MNVLIINLILFTPDNGVIPQNKSIKDTMIHALCKGFLKGGHSVTLVASEEYRPIENESYEFDIVYMRSGLKKIFKPAFLPYPVGLARFLRERAGEFDVVVSSECFSMGSLVAASILPKKLVIWQEQIAHQRKFFKLPSKIWYNLICKLYFGKGEVVACRSERAQSFTSSYLKNVSRTIIEHGVDGEKFNRDLHKKDYVITSSQLIKRKNIDHIIRMFSKFIGDKKYEHYKLIIAGRGEEEESLRTLVTSLGVVDSIEFVGYLPQVELSKLIGGAKAFLIASTQDLNMVSVPECVVCCTPILMTSVPSSSSYIKAFGLGIVKDKWTEHDLREIIENSEVYVDRCNAYRDRLLCSSVAESFLSLVKEVQ